MDETRQALIDRHVGQGHTDVSARCPDAECRRLLAQLREQARTVFRGS